MFARLRLYGFLLLVGTGCRGDDIGHDSPLVGGFCSNDAECVERCVRGNEFPGGTCTVECRNDGDCPLGTFCIDVAGGVCLLPCSVDDDCRPSYECETRRRRGHGGEAAICIDD